MKKNMDRVEEYLEKCTGCPEKLDCDKYYMLNEMLSDEICQGCTSECLFLDMGVFLTVAGPEISHPMISVHGAPEMLVLHAPHSDDLLLIEAEMMAMRDPAIVYTGGRQPLDTLRRVFDVLGVKDHFDNVVDTGKLVIEKAMMHVSEVAQDHGILVMGNALRTQSAEELVSTSSAKVMIPIEFVSPPADKYPKDLRQSGHRMLHRQNWPQRWTEIRRRH